MPYAERHKTVGLGRELYDNEHRAMPYAERYKAVGLGQKTYKLHRSPTDFRHSAQGNALRNGRQTTRNNPEVQRTSGTQRRATPYGTDDKRNKTTYEVQRTSGSQRRASPYETDG